MEDHARDSNFKTEFFDFIEIGRGGFGTVYSATNAVDLCKYAVKKVKLRKQNGNNEKITTELRILAKLHHPNVVRYHTSWFQAESVTVGVNSEIDEEESENNFSSSNKHTPSESDSGAEFVRDPNASEIRSEPLSSQSDSGAEFSRDPNSTEILSRPLSSQTSLTKPINNLAVESFSKQNSSINDRLVIYIQMELCDDNLKIWLDSRNNRPGSLDHDDRKSTQSLSLQLLSGVEYIHSNNIVHRDIKPANIFLQRRGADCALQLKIGDFGLAKYLISNSEDKDCQPMSANVGTALYTAPEVLSERRKYVNYDHKCDLYSVGVILLEMMMKMPTSTELWKTIERMSSSGSCDNLSAAWPIEAPYVMGLLSKDVAQRPSARFIIHDTMAFREFAIENSEYKEVMRLTEENRSLKMRLAEENNQSSTALESLDRGQQL